MWPSDHAGVVATLAIKSPVNPATDSGVSQLFRDAWAAWNVLSELVASEFMPQLVFSGETDLFHFILETEITALRWRGAAINVSTAEVESGLFDTDLFAEPRSHILDNSFFLPVEERQERTLVNPLDDGEWRDNVLETVLSLEQDFFGDLERELLATDR